MKKRFLFLSFLFLFVTALTSCNGVIGGGGGGLDLGKIDVDGIDNEIVDTKNGKISFSVPLSVEKFEVSRFKVGEGIKIVARDASGKDITDSIILKEGVNELALVFKLNDQEIKWKLVITREDKAPKPDSVATGFTLLNPKSLYKVNEEFVSFNIEVSYNDGSVKKVAVTKEMAKGFDTSKAGDVVVTIEYQEFKQSYTITVANDINPDSKIERVTIVSYTKDYVIGEAFKGAKARVYYSDGTEVVADIELSYLDSFNTNAAGSYTITGRYKGVDFSFDIEVHAEAQEISYRLDGVQESYTIGEAFNGNVIKTINSVDTAYRITADMIIGFDNTKAGSQKVTITFETFTKEVTVNVLEEALTEAHVKDAMCHITAFYMVARDNNDIESAFDRYLKMANEKISDDDVLDVYNYLKDIEATSGQVKSISTLIRNNGLRLGAFIKSVEPSGHMNPLLEIFMAIDDENLTLAKDTINALANIFTSEQICKLYAHSVEVPVEDRFAKYNEALQRIIHVDLDEVLKEVNNKEFEAFLKSGYEINKLPSFNEQVEFVDFAKAMIQRICEIKNNDIFQIRDMLTQPEFILANEKSRIRRIGTILYDITGAPEFEGFLSGLAKISGAIPAKGMDDITNLNATQRYVGFIARKAPVVFEYISKLDDKVFTAIDSLISSQQGPDLNAVKTLAATALDIISKINTSAADKEDLAFILEIITGNENAASIIITNITKVSTIVVNPDGTAADMEMQKLQEAMEAIQGLFMKETMPEKSYYREYDLVVPKNATVEVFKVLFNQSYTFYSDMKPDFGKPGEMPAEPVINEAGLAENLKVAGLHYFKVTYNNVEYELPYYVYDDGDDSLKVINYNSQSINQSEIMVYTDKAGNVIKVGFVGAIYDDKPYEIDDFKNNLRVYVYSKRLHRVLRPSFDPAAMTLKMVSANTNKLKLGVLEYNTPFGTGKCIVNYTTVDKDHLVCTVYSTTNTQGSHTLIQNSEMNFIVAIYNYGYLKEEYRITNKELDTSKLGKVSYDTPYGKLEFEVISKEDGEKLDHIDGLGIICNEEIAESLKLQDNYIRYTDKRGYEGTLPINEFIDRFYPGSTIELKVVNNIYERYYHYDISFVKDGAALAKYEFNMEAISQEEFNEVFYNFIYPENYEKYLTDEEYAKLSAMSLAGKVKYAEEKLNTFGIYAVSKKDPKPVEHPHALDYLKENKVAYEIAIEENEGSIRAIVLIDNMPAFELDFTTLSNSMQNPVYVELYRNSASIESPKELNTNVAMDLVATAYDFMVKTETGGFELKDKKDKIEFLKAQGAQIEILHSDEFGFDFSLMGKTVQYKGHLSYLSDAPVELKIVAIYSDPEPAEEYVDAEIIARHIKEIVLIDSYGKEIHLKDYNDILPYASNAYVEDAPGAFIVNIEGYDQPIKIMGKEEKPMPEGFIKVENTNQASYEVCPKAADVLNLVKSGEVALSYDVNGKVTNLNDMKGVLDTLKFINSSYDEARFYGIYTVRINEFDYEFTIMFNRRIVTPDPTKVTPIELVLMGNKEEAYKVNGEVICIASNMYFVKDETGILMVDRFSKANCPKLGEVVEISGKLKEYNSQKKFYAESITKSSTLIQAQYPVEEFTAEDFTNYTYGYPSMIAIKHVKFNAKIVVSGKYINFTMPGLPKDIIGSLKLDDQLVEEFKGYNGLEGTFSGYLAYVSNSGQKHPTVFVESFDVKVTDEILLKNEADSFMAGIPEGDITREITIQKHNPNVVIIVSTNLKNYEFDGTTLVLKPTETVEGNITVEFKLNGLSMTRIAKLSFVASSADVAINMDAFKKLDKAMQDNLDSAGEIMLAPGIKVVFNKDKSQNISKFDGIYVRFYAATKMTIISDKPIKMLEFIPTTSKSNSHLKATADSGVVDENLNTWTGSATTIVLSAIAQFRFSGINVYYA